MKEFLNLKNSSSINSEGIGGRNLLLCTRNFGGDKWINNVATFPTDLTNSYYKNLKVYQVTSDWRGMRQYVNLEANQTYTLSCYLKANKANISVAMYAATGINGIKLTTNCSLTWKRYHVTFVAPSDVLALMRVEPENITSIGGTLYVCGLKLEKSSIMTDYNEAIEDISIGGVNLLNNSNSPELLPIVGLGTSIKSIVNGINPYGTNVTNKIIKLGYVSTDTNRNFRLNNAISSDGTYTFSAWMKSDTDDTHLSIDMCDRSTQNITLSTSWKKVVLVFDVNNYSSSVYHFIDFYNTDKNVDKNIYMYRLQVERGNKDTDFNISPDDLQSQINSKLPLTGGTLSGTLDVNTNISINNKNGGDCAIKMLRGTKADWDMLVSKGNLFIRTNYTDADGKGSYFPVLTAEYNTGDIKTKGTIYEAGTALNKKYLALTNGETMNSPISSSVASKSFIAGNTGTAIINSNAAAGFNMLARLKSTNGVFMLGHYQGSLHAYYTADTVIAAKTNTITKDAILLNEVGNMSIPGIIYEGGTALSAKYQAKGNYASTAVATSTANGLMSSTDKLNLSNNLWYNARMSSNSYVCQADVVSKGSKKLLTLVNGGIAPIDIYNASSCVTANASTFKFTVLMAGYYHIHGIVHIGMDTAPSGTQYAYGILELHSSLATSPSIIELARANPCNGVREIRAFDITIYLPKSDTIYFYGFNHAQSSSTMSFFISQLTIERILQ